MKRIAFGFFIVAIVITGCGRGPSGATSGADKIEGPSVNSLSHEQLMAVYSECTAFGRMDDPRVKYTTRYCSAVNSAQEMEGYASLSAAKVDPNSVRMH
jgi:hypothetical protein